MSKRNILNPANLVDNKVAGNGLLDRRMLLRGGLFSAGIVSAKASDITPDWMKVPGRSFSPYGMPSKWQEKVQRTFAVLPDRAGTGSSRTPLHLMETFEAIQLSNPLTKSWRGIRQQTHTTTRN
jgi:hypothetical protein